MRRGTSSANRLRSHHRRIQEGTSCLASRLAPALRFAPEVPRLTAGGDHDAVNRGHPRQGYDTTSRQYGMTGSRRGRRHGTPEPECVGLLAHETDHVGHVRLERQLEFRGPAAQVVA